MINGTERINIKPVSFLILCFYYTTVKSQGCSNVVCFCLCAIDLIIFCMLLILNHKDLFSVFFYLIQSFIKSLKKIFLCSMFNDREVLGDDNQNNDKQFKRNECLILELLEKCLLSCHFLSSVAPHLTQNSASVYCPDFIFCLIVN